MEFSTARRLPFLMIQHSCGTGAMFSASVFTSTAQETLAIYKESKLRVSINQRSCGILRHANVSASIFTILCLN